MIPAWLERITGGVGRRARLDPCPRCRQWTLLGLDHDVAAGTARVDTQPITLEQEIAARLSGLFTYDAIPVGLGQGRRVELLYRDQDRITQRQYPVLVDHKCLIVSTEEVA